MALINLPAQYVVETSSSLIERIYKLRKVREEAFIDAELKSFDKSICRFVFKRPTREMIIRRNSPDKYLMYNDYIAARIAYSDELEVLNELKITAQLAIDKGDSFIAINNKEVEVLNSSIPDE